MTATINYIFRVRASRVEGKVIEQTVQDYCLKPLSSRGDRKIHCTTFSLNRGGMLFDFPVYVGVETASGFVFSAPPQLHTLYIYKLHSVTSLRASLQGLEQNWTQPKYQDNH